MAMVIGAGNKLSLEHDVGREAAGLDRPSIARLDRIVEIPAGYLRGAGGIGRLAEGNITARRAWIGPRCRLSRRIGKLHITNLPGRNTRRRRRVAHGNDNGICDYEALLDHRAADRVRHLHKDYRCYPCPRSCRYRNGGQHPTWRNRPRPPECLCTPSVA